jgi:nucleotide-binding universal stress UspA family protein
VLAHVIDPFCYPFGDEYAGVDSARLMEEARASAHAEMNELAARANVPCLILIREGSPAREICNLARRDIDLIVTPTHGRTGFGHVLIGSVAERVVRHATCPVLVIPMRAKRKIAPVASENLQDKMIRRE